MSSDARLERLGLSHLADRPKELKKELARRIKEDKKAEERIALEMEEQRRRLGLEQRGLPSDKPDTGEIGRSRSPGQGQSQTRPAAGLRQKR